MQDYLKYDANRLIKMDLTAFGIERSDCYIYLDYLNHSQLSGNKLRKLFGNIEYIKQRQYNTIITIGGHYSNYLYACSFLPELENIQVVFIIKGHKPKEFGYTLTHIQEKNIPMYFYSKENVKHNLPEILSDLKSKYSNSIFVPEGASNEYSHLGFKSLVENNFNDFNYICVPVGTLGTYNGVKKYMSKESQIIGYAAHNDYSLKELGNIRFDYSFGGFAKMTDELYKFVLKFKSEIKIELDTVYTSKMLYGIIEDYKKGIFTASEKIVALHTGGLQGWNGMSQYGLKKRSSVGEPNSKIL